MNVQEAARPDETVADRLRAAYDCWPLLRAVEGRRPWHELTREDWVRPLKLTGGRVCLRETHPKSDERAWFTVRSDTLVFRDTGGNDHTAMQAIEDLHYAMNSSSIRLRPVVIEETPFAEDSHV